MFWGSQKPESDRNSAKSRIRSSQMFQKALLESYRFQNRFRNWSLDCVQSLLRKLLESLFGIPTSLVQIEQDLAHMRCGGVTLGTEPDHLSCEPFLLEHDQFRLNLSTACSAREVHVMVGPYYEKVFRRQPEDGRTLSGINLEAIVIGRCGGRSASGSSLSLSPFIASQWSCLTWSRDHTPAWIKVTETTSNSKAQPEYLKKTFKI